MFFQELKVFVLKWIPLISKPLHQGMRGLVQQLIIANPGLKRN